ncbi:MAG: MATE family efflux transporter [Lachnospiraceae bacterium]|nr:MATE family efflux transporter [Lachnospiraceae bacterium]
MGNKKNEIDMLNGPLFKKIMTLALPLAAISILQQLFNAADVAVVGRFAGKEALAAVGANATVVSMFLTFFSGLAIGANVAVATLIGRGEHGKIKACCQSIFTMSLIGAFLVIILGELFARPLLTAILTPENILDSAVLYLRIYLFAMAFAVVYNFCSAILRSKGDSKRPLYCLVASGIINVLLNLLFVIVFHLDVAGVALATLISNAVCCIACIIILMKEEEPFKLTVTKLTLHKAPLVYALKIGFPAGLQGMIFSISNLIIQSGINSFGADSTAGNTAAMNFEYICFFVVSAFSQTATTFISQNYGAEKYKRCRKIFVECLILAMVFSLSFCLCFVLGHGFWLSLFTTEKNVLSYAMIRMTHIVLWEFLTATYDVPSAALRGRGVSMPPTIATIIGSCVLRIIWVVTIFRWKHTLGILLLVYPVSWAFIAACVWVMYIRLIKKDPVSEE